MGVRTVLNEWKNLVGGKTAKLVEETSGDINLYLNGTTSPAADGNPVLQGVSDANSNLVGIVNPKDGLPRGDLQQFVPATNDYAGILAAFNAAVANGGGIVKLLPITYNIGANTLSMASNVQYIGSGFTTTYGGIPDSASAVLNGGTIIQGNGTANIFAYNATDRVTDLASTLVFAQAGITSTGISNLGIRNGLYGIKGGAYKNPSFWYSTFDNIWIEDCTTAGVWFENYLHCSIKKIFTFRCGGGAKIYDANGNDTTGGQVYACSGAAMLTSGNSYQESLYNVISNNADNMKQRAIRFITRGNSGMNSVTVVYPQSSRFNQTTSTQAATCNTTANITVIDGTRFALEMPVSFSGTAYGFNANKIYFVTSIVGNVIQVADTIKGTAKIASGTGSSLGNVFTSGFPCIECVGYDTSEVNIEKIGTIDAEGGGTTKIVLQNHSGTIDAHAFNNDAFSSQELVLRDSTTSFFNVDKNVRVDIDATSLLFASGTINSTLVNKPPVGLYKLGSFMALNFNATGSSLLDFVAADSGWGNVIKQSVNTAISQVPYTFTNVAASPLNLGAYAQAITFNGTANGGIQLRQITNNSVGVVFEICNPTAFTVAITSFSASQLFNNKAASTVLTMAANSSVKLRMDVLNGVYFIAVLATVGTVTF